MKAQRDAKVSKAERKPKGRRSYPPSELVGCTEAAHVLGLAPNTLRMWCREGFLMDHAVRLPNGYYRIPRAVVELLKQGRDLPPAPPWKRKPLPTSLPPTPPANTDGSESQ